MNTLDSFADPLPDRWWHVVDPSFAKDIMPLFREKDRSSMRNRFDLWSCRDVRDNGAAILEALRAGTMPCDGTWSSDKVDRFARWIGSGMAD
jgi:hypothetical protein